MKENFLIFGTAESPRPPVVLSAGPVTAVLEEDSGFLRRICYRGTEAVRGIYGAVRDRNWGTVAPRMQRVQIDSHEDAFEVRLEADCCEGDIHFRWRGTITGDKSGSLVYDFDGEALTMFDRNRIGLCVLYPLGGCAGRPCEVELVDSTRHRATFPDLIFPHQPFRDLRSVRHEVLAGVTVEVRMEGETFEMEDQRNWTDASFKAYGTPLSLPFPVTVRPGEGVHQTVTVHFSGAPASPIEGVPKAIRPIKVSFVRGPTRPRPSLGFCLPEGIAKPDATILKRLSALQPDHLRADIRMGDPEWTDRLRRADVVAGQAESRLLLALHFTGNVAVELEELEKRLRLLETKVALVLVYQEGRKTTPLEVLAAVQERLHRRRRIPTIAAGTDAFFAELNRQRPSSNSSALPCFSINPQVHASDALSLMENLEAQPQAVDTAAAFSGKPVVVSPVTLRMRWNPNATGPEPSLLRGELPPSVDPRQMSLFGAAWTLGSLARLFSHPHLHGLTYYEAWGWRGLMAAETESPSASRFPARPRDVYPMYYVFYDLAGFRVGPDCKVSDPETIAALAIASGEDRLRLLVANLSPRAQSIELEAPLGTIAVRALEAAQLDAMTPAAWSAPTPARSQNIRDGNPVSVGPYGYLRVDWRDRSVNSHLPNS